MKRRGAKVIPSRPAGEHPNPDHWKKVRNDALRRDGGKCRICGSNKRPEVHHIHYDNYGEEELDDVTTLCKGHHWMITMENKARRVTEAADLDKLELIDNEGERLWYAPNQQTPYTGPAKKDFLNGAQRGWRHYKDGKRDGKETNWWRNGQKMCEIFWVGGKLMSAKDWKKNGERDDTKVEDGNGVWVVRRLDGKESCRHTVKDGEIVRD